MPVPKRVMFQEKLNVMMNVEMVSDRPYLHKHPFTISAKC